MLKKIESPRQSNIEPLESRIAPAIIFVTSTADSGPKTLRQAIIDSNGTPEVDTIKFTLPVDSLITLTSEIAVTDSVKIIGPGAGKLTVSGGGTNRIFNISDGTAGLKDVLVQGLTLTNGAATAAGADGGAIISVENLTILSSVLTNNVCDSDGGAVHVGSSTILGAKFLLKNSKVTGNHATNGDGGGLYLRAGGGIQIVGSVISGNTAGDNGGALYGRIDPDQPGDILIDKSTIAGNISTNSGGGVWLKNLRLGTDTTNGTADDGKITISNSSITGNRATAASASGGGLYLGDGNLFIQKTNIGNNSATTRGGGLFVLSSADSLTIKSSKITQNFTTDTASTGTGGGGVYISGDATPTAVTIQSSLFYGNRSASDGGAISALDGVALKVISSTFTNNAALGDDGGAIYVDPTAGGTDVSLDVKASKFLDNSSSNDGGAISTVGAGAVSVTGSLFSENRAGDDGAGIDTTGGSVIAIKASKFIGNVSLGEGGAMYLRSSAAISVISSLISKNTAVANGGGISLGQAGSKTIKGTKIIDNVSAGSLGGGGIAVFGAGSLEVLSSIITGNVSATAGGGIFKFIAGTTVMITGGKLADNSAPTAPQKNF